MTTLHTHIYILADSLWSDLMKHESVDELQERLDGKIKEWIGIIRTEITRKKIIITFLGELTDDAEVREWMNQVMRGASHWPGVFIHLGRAEPILQHYKANPRELEPHEFHGLRTELLRESQRLIAGTSRHISPEEAMRRSVWLLTLIIESLL